MKAHFDVALLTFIIDTDDKPCLASSRRRLGYFGAFIWSDIITAAHGESLESLLRSELDDSGERWIAGVWSARSSTSTWARELIALKGMPNNRQALLRHAVLVVGNAPQRVPSSPVKTWDFTGDPKAAFYGALLSDVLPLEGLRAKLRETYCHAIEMIDGLGRRDKDFDGYVAALRSSINLAIRYRYIYEKLSRREVPNSKRELGPWRQLDYVRNRTRHPFDNRVFSIMEAKQEQLRQLCDIRSALEDQIDVFAAGLPSLKQDMEALCLVKEP